MRIIEIKSALKKVDVALLVAEEVVSKVSRVDTTVDAVTAVLMRSLAYEIEEEIINKTIAPSYFLFNTLPELRDSEGMTWSDLESVLIYLKEELYAG